MLTCGIWVRRGVAKEVPDKVEITADELKELLQETKEQINDLGENVEDLDEIQKKVVSGEDLKYEDSDDEIKAEYGLDDYDQEGTEMTGAGMAGLMYFVSTEDDPYVDLKGMEAEDIDNYIIKSNDNLFVVGKMEEEHSCLDIYVYNEEESSQYVHHDILLESYPLCLEWLSYDPALEGKSGNYVAVGTMEPDILIWDLDIVDVVEPAFVLSGMKKRKKKKSKASLGNSGNGHKDAVLSLTWNQNIKNVLGSGSADKTIKLWDMSKCECVHTLTHHTDKVQSIQWHPHESQSLLSGSFDKKAVLLDCRTPNIFKSWSLSGECEKVLWDHLSPCNFYVSTDDGVVCYCDVRTDQPVFTLHAHEQAVTGMCLASNIPGLLTTVSSDKKLKVWDTKGNKPTCVLSREMKMGGLNFVSCCPDVSNLCAIGGEKDGVRILNIMETTQGKEYFQNSNPELKSENNEDKAPDKRPSMDIDVHVDAMQTLSLKTDSQKSSGIIRKKKKKKK